MQLNTGCVGRCREDGSYSVVMMTLPSPHLALGEVTLAFWVGHKGRIYSTVTGKHHKSELSEHMFSEQHTTRLSLQGMTFLSKWHTWHLTKTVETLGTERVVALICIYLTYLI